MEEEGTYLEDFLVSLELLPNDVRRDFELMKELDRECVQLSKDLNNLEEQYLANATSLVKNKKTLTVEQSTELETTNTKLMEEIVSIRDRARQKLAEKSAMALNLTSIIERFTRKLDTDLAFFETELKSSGEFEAPKGAAPGSQVAFRITQEATEEKSMILGRVISYMPDLGQYSILDVDDSKTYILAESDVVVLDLVDSQRKLSKGEVLFALYPDTTSFYLATVSQAPRRTAMGMDPTVVVQFNGDEDENGIIPHRQVPLKYIVRPQMSDIAQSLM